MFQTQFWQGSEHMHHDKEEIQDEELFKEKPEELGGLQLPVCGHWLLMDGVSRSRRGSVFLIGKEWTRKWNWKVKVLVAQLCPTLCSPADCSPSRLLSLSMEFSRQELTRVSCHSLLQGIFLTQKSNLDLLHCRRIVYWLSYEGSP